MRAASGPRRERAGEIAGEIRRAEIDDVGWR